MAQLSIGALSQKSGIKIPTIRYYEEIGLFPVADRSDSGRRIYSATDVKRAIFVRHSRTLGFSLEDIRSLLSLLNNPEQSCQNADAIAKKHLKQVNDHISALQELRDELIAMVKNCPGKDAENCNVIKTLSDHSQCLHDEHK